MPIGTSDGRYYEDEASHALGIEMPKEEEAVPTPEEYKQQTPLRITVGGPKEPVIEDTVAQIKKLPDKLTWGDMPGETWKAFKSDMSKLGDSIVHALTLGPKLMEKVYKGEIDPLSDEGIKHVNEIALNFGLGGIATAPMREGAGMFGGKLAARSSPEASTKLAEAESLNLDKKLNEFPPEAKAQYIYNKTGWEKDPAGNWVFEISDKKSKLKLENLEGDGLETNWISGEAVNKYSVYSQHEADAAIEALLSNKPQVIKTVGDVLEHPELYKHYPEAAKIPLERLTAEEEAKFGGYYSYGTGGIGVGSASKKDLHSIILHELQHYIQHKEKLPTGGDWNSYIKEDPGLIEKVKGYLKDLGAALGKRWGPLDETINAKFGKEWHEESFSKRIAITDIVGIISRFQKGRELSALERRILIDVQSLDPHLLADINVRMQASKLLTKIEGEAMVKYRQLWGEYQARATQARQHLTDEQRLNFNHRYSEEFKATYPDGVIPEEALKRP